MPNNKSKNQIVPHRKRKGRSRKAIPEHSIFKGMGKRVLIVPIPFLIMTPALVTRFVFMSTLHSPLNNSGLSYANIRFRPTSLFDVDPALGGTSCPGFDELTAIYGKYRVLRFRYKVTAANDEPHPLNFLCFLTNFDNGANYSQVQSQFGNSFSKYRFLSAKGGMDRATISSGWMSQLLYVGSDSVMYDDDYAANSNASPANNLYLYVAIWTGNTNLLTVGVSLQIVITIEGYLSENLHNVTKPDPPEFHPELRQALVKKPTKASI